MQAKVTSRIITCLDSCIINGEESIAVSIRPYAFSWNFVFDQDRKLMYSTKLGISLIFDLQCWVWCELGALTYHPP